MALYGFSLNVPVQPAIVADRLRAALSKFGREDTSKALFVGWVSENSFRVRANVGIGSFWPDIFGRVTAQNDEACVRVRMVMHPAAILGTVSWFIFWIFREISPVESPIAHLPLLMVLSGLLVSLARFFAGASRSKFLLSSVLLDSTITGVPATQPSTIASEAAGATTRRRIWPAITIALCAILVLIAPLYTAYLRSSPAFSQSVGILSRDPAAIAALGAPIKADFFIRGAVKQDSTSGYALLSIPVHGSKAKGTFYVIANRYLDHWDMERLVLRSSDSKRLDISPPLRPEQMPLPATGPVYLLPLDQNSAALLADLSGYLRARVELSVSVLPVRELDPRAIDPATQQVIGERAREFVQTIPDFAANPDSVIVAVTSRDLLVQTEDHPFALNYHRGNVAIVSTRPIYKMPWGAGENPEAGAIRLRKLVARNVALIRYPIAMSADVTSLVAYGTSRASEIDEIGEHFIGEQGRWMPMPGSSPCVTVTQGPSRVQTMRADCTGDMPSDSRIETFVNYADLPLLVESRTDFPYPSQNHFSFIRASRAEDDRSRAFGVGANSSFDIFPVGDSQTFGSLELILADGGHVDYKRVSKGSSYQDAVLRTGPASGSPFSNSTLKWNGNGWDVLSIDGWRWRFPASGPDIPPERSALLQIDGHGQRLTIARAPSGALKRATLPDGSWIEFTADEHGRVALAQQSSGRSVRYEYDAAGRLIRVSDSENGQESYEYDNLNRMTAVRDSRGTILLKNTYGSLDELTSQTLADGRMIKLGYGFDERHQPIFVRLTDWNGYVIDWNLTAQGFVESWPRLPKQ